MPHSVSIRVYYEDTDAAGIVYYANYLKFAERARTEWLRSLGYHQSVLLGEQGIGFVVTRCEIDYMHPAALDDILVIQTHLQEVRKVRMNMHQTIIRGETILARLVVTIACINKAGKPIKLPQALIKTLAANTH